MPRVELQPMTSVFQRAKTFLAQDHAATVTDITEYYSPRVKLDEAMRANN
jgi:hypothetical protein